MLVKGDIVRVRLAGHHHEDWTDARVALASENGKSLALELNGMVRTADGGLIGGVLCLLVDLPAQTICGLDGSPYEILVSPQATQRVTEESKQ
jgi:hypothetical protein